MVTIRSHISAHLRDVRRVFGLLCARRGECVSDHTTIPGFQTHLPTTRRTSRTRKVPGFQAHQYRDFGHSEHVRLETPRTGISSTLLPGHRAHGYRDSKHAGTGSRGIVSPRTTGIRGTLSAGNHLTRLANSPSNSVLHNRSSNSPTRGAALFHLGGGEW